MSVFCFFVLSILYILVQSKSVDVQTESLEYKILFAPKNEETYLDSIFKEGSKINFQNFLLKESSFKNVMNISDVLKDSDIFYLCDKNIPNLNNSVDLSHVKKYPGMLLCLGLSHVLMLNGMLFTQKASTNQKLSTLPKSKSELDMVISNMNANDTLKHKIMCENHKITLPKFQSDVVEYVKLLNPLLDDLNMCKTMCLDLGDSINPICAFIMEANDIFYNNIKKIDKNSTTPSEYVDSAKAIEQSSRIDKMVSITKEITDNSNKDSVPINEGNVVSVLKNSFNHSALIDTKTNVKSIYDESSIQSRLVKTVGTDKPNTSTTPRIALTPLVDVDESVEITNDDAGDYPIQTEGQPPKQDTTLMKTNENPPDKISPEPQKKNINKFGDDSDVDDAANEAEGDTLEANEFKPSKFEDKTVSNSVLKLKEKTTKISSQKIKSTPPKTSANTVIEIKEDSGNDNNEALPPPIENNVDTLEGDNILINSNNNGEVNNDDEEFSSNIDQKNYKQQGDDTGDFHLDVQENTPYIIPKDGFIEAEESHFFSYFLLMFVVCMAMYLVFYNKRKLLALALEGRHESGRRIRSRRGTYSRVNTGHDESKEHLLY